METLQSNFVTEEDIQRAIERDPVGFMFAVWDAENAEDAETAEAAEAFGAEFWERAIVDFAAHERIKPEPFRYSSCDHPSKLKRKPWLDFGRNWPYCFTHLRGHDVWLPLGRNYKPLGQKQWPGGFYDYNTFAHTAWRFLDDPRALDGVWTQVGDYQLWLYNDGRASRRDYFRRVGRLLAATVDPLATLRQMAGNNNAPPPAPAPVSPRHGPPPPAPSAPALV
jgi:hypothetical protein